jgi:UDP-N-acetylmuramate--alanine ligase
VTDIYQVAGREKKEKVDIKAFVKAIKKEKKEITLVKDYERVCSYLISKLKPGDVVITMGAGTITEISDELLEKI